MSDPSASAEPAIDPGRASGDEPWSEHAIGFGGAPVRSLDALPQVASGCFFGVDSELSRTFGAHNEGAAVFIRSRSARMAPWAEHAPRLGYRPTVDLGVLRGSPAQLRDDLVTLGVQLRSHGHIPVAIGCDHTMSYALALGVACGGPVTYVYFDAHLDLGLHHDRPQPQLDNGNFVGALVRSDEITEVVNVGARAWSTHAPCYAGDHDVRIIRESSPEGLVRALESLRGRDVHVSVDADVLDPTWVPNVCCPEPFGLEPRVLLSTLGWLGRHCRVRGADFSEMVPDEARGHTAEVAMRCMHELLRQPRNEIER